MGKIFALEGPKGVGKTTLLKNLKILCPDLDIFEGFQLNKSECNLNSKTKFYVNQKIYINQKISQYKEIRNTKNNSIVTRGTENILMFTLKYSSLYNFKYNSKKKLKKEIKNLNLYKSDLIIYLDASNKNILKRCSNDNIKNRKNIEEWMKLWIIQLKNWFKKYDYLKIIDTNNKSPMDVAKEVKKIIEE